MKFKDYYAALGVARDADPETIKRAYRRLARQHHPDVAREPGSEAKFKEVAEAWATLRDPGKRAAYDQLGQRAPGDEFAPPPDWRHMYADDAHAFDDIDLADVLAAFGHAGAGTGHRAGRRPVHGRDFEAGVQISLEDAHRGTTVSLDVAHEDGSHTLAVTIPPGVTDGQRLRLRGRGGRGRHGGRDGDIYLHVSLLPHPRLRADGHDLHFDLALSPWEAALGAEVEVPTLDGPVLLSVPAGTSSGRRLRMRGRGLATGKGGHGDLYAVVHVAVPTVLDERERALFEQLARESRFNPRLTVGQEKAHASRSR